MDWSQTIQTWCNQVQGLQYFTNAGLTVFTQSIAEKCNIDLRNHGVKAMCPSINPWLAFRVKWEEVLLRTLGFRVLFSFETVVQCFSFDREGKSANVFRFIQTDETSADWYRPTVHVYTLWYRCQWEKVILKFHMASGLGWQSRA